MKGDFWFVLLSHAGDVFLSGHVTRAGPAPMSRHAQPRSRKPELLASTELGSLRNSDATQKVRGAGVARAGPPDVSNVSATRAALAS